MSYFTFFPNTEYSLPGQKPIVLRDIMMRAKILEGMRSLVGTYAEYTIADGERPEHIAHRVYGRPDYHWMILLFNEIHDPYYEWPMSTGEMEKHIEKTYPGKALIVNTGGIVEGGRAAIFNETIGVPHDRRKPHFETGFLIEQMDESSQKLASTNVYSWDPNLWKIVVSSELSGSFRLLGDAAKTSIETGELLPILDPSSLQKDIHCANSQGHSISTSLIRVTEENRHAIHHFEDENGIEVSPWLVPKGSSSPLIERYALGRQESINTAEGTYTFVTNSQYEDRKNEAKRKIRVMKPAYTDAVIRQLSALVG